MYIRPLDEAAKQIYRNNPEFALQVEGLSWIFTGIMIAACVILGKLIS